MRPPLALLAVVVLAAGCRSARPRVSDRGDAPPQPGYESLASVAEELSLAYVPDGEGVLEMSDPPDSVVFLPESCTAFVNGRHVDLDTPCRLRGDEYAITISDAAFIRELFLSSRALREEPVRPAVGFPARRGEPGLLPQCWRPRVPSRRWSYIIIHHSASDHGSAAYIDRAHRNKGWDGLGYHFVIGNGTLSGDGSVEVGGRWARQEVGAHARVPGDESNRWNEQGIGIVLVGNFQGHRPSRRQLEAVVALVRALRSEYGIPLANVIGHRDVKATECPGDAFPWGEFVERIR
ncbi:MAG: peptidoglycan recognition protein family protein [Planctomycetota bacterium]